MTINIAMLKKSMERLHETLHKCFIFGFCCLCRINVDGVMLNFPPDKIEAQLKRILATPEFVAGKKMSQFLRYVVEHSLNDQSNIIKQFTIAVEALGYGADFDPTATPSVRIVARRLRRALEQYYLAQGIEDPIRIDIPKGGYIPTFTENNTELETPDSSECPSPAVAPTPFEASKPSIAVMMFVCLDFKGECDYVATGLTEEIIIALSLFPEFIVVGPLSKDVIQQQRLDAGGIGQIYGVRFALDGTLRTQGDMFRLTLRLIDTVSGQQLWGQKVDCSLQNGSMMALEDDLVGQVAATIADGAVLHPVFKKGGWFWKGLMRCGFFDPQKPVIDFTEQELHDLLYKEPTTFVNVHQGEEYNSRYEGVIIKLKRRFINMEEGVDAAMTNIAESIGQQWHAMRDAMRDEGRYHVETY